MVDLDPTLAVHIAFVLVAEWSESDHLAFLRLLLQRVLHLPAGIRARLPAHAALDHEHEDLRRIRPAVAVAVHGDDLRQYPVREELHERTGICWIATQARRVIDDHSCHLAPICHIEDLLEDRPVVWNVGAGGFLHDPERVSPLLDRKSCVCLFDVLDLIGNRAELLITLVGGFTCVADNELRMECLLGGLCHCRWGNYEVKEKCSQGAPWLPTPHKRGGHGAPSGHYELSFTR
ncbi:MAG: hypothetical protein WC840_03780 [Candidatus Peribacteraceae bacterium]